jgi:DNA topoisomerase-1
MSNSDSDEPEYLDQRADTEYYAQYDEKKYYDMQRGGNNDSTHDTTQQLIQDIIDMKRKVLHEIFSVQFGGGEVKWKEFEHQGVAFPPEYVPHGEPLKCNGQDVKLTPEAEEVAMLYARYMGSEYMENKTFNKNFWNDWKKILGPNHSIKALDDCDFSRYHAILEEMKVKKKELKDLQKDDEKSDPDEKYKTAMVDGKTQPVGNFKVEPPGIFIGRGDNPKLGRLKRRVYPEDITINVGKGTVVPLPDWLVESGHNWGAVVHDPTVEWLASWKDLITNKTKYVWLGASSDFKASSDEQKFELARKLKRKYNTIMEENDKNLLSDDKKTMEVAVALWLIANQSIRAGNEKSEGADTVGASSLRVEHIKLLPNNHIGLSFLGKDSVPFNKNFEVPPVVYKDIAKLLEGKSKGDPLFELASADDINKYLQTFMKNLSSKIFRTANASKLFQKELIKINKKFEGVEDKALLLDAITAANIRVAALCNHQKCVGKSTSKGKIDKIDEMIKKTKSNLRKALKSTKKSPEKIEKLRNKIKLLQSKKGITSQLKNLSVETSKANYIDPRIIVSFMKLHNLPISLIFSKALIQKFSWAFDAPVDFKF